MSRALFSVIWLGVIVFPLTAVNAQNNKSAAPKNVLLICVDDLKPLLGCYGDPIAKTPQIDRLAAQGVLFERSYCNQAVCSPSRNALLTSLRPQTLGIYDLGTNFRKAAPDAVTLPQHFQQQGYHTQSLGKIFHVGHGNNDDQASWSVPSFKGKGNYALESSKNKRGGEKGAAYEAAEVPDNAYADGQVADEAVARLQSMKGKLDQPFFLAVGFVKPHLPFCAPQKYWDLYQRSDFNPEKLQVVPVGAPDYAPTPSGELRGYEGIPSKDQALPDDLQRSLIHGYYAAMSYMDTQVGRVLDALKSSGHANDTVIVLWGDHGYHLGDHGMWCKHTNYEQAARIPVIVSIPGGPQGKRVNALIESVDIYPTLCELAGLPVPAGLDGRSFAATAKDPQQPHRDHVIHVYPRDDRLGRAIRTERYRLVEWKEPGAGSNTADLELYDYQADPQETSNLASEQAEVVATLQRLLQQHPEARPSILNKSKTPTAEPKQDRKALFKRKDMNGDGRLDRDEFMANQSNASTAAARFPKFDSNKDGVLSEEEFVLMGKSR